MITAGPHNVQWLLTCLYGSPRYQEKKELWENITTRSRNMQVPWMIIGDRISPSTLKKRSQVQNRLGQASTSESRNGYFQTDLLDVTFSGYPYTWSNHETSNSASASETRQKAMANSKWHDIFQSAKVYSLNAFGSDHSPIILHTNQPTERIQEAFR
ncbi:hypothetical protein MKW92_003384, partial [Papaver armeniacum]